MNAQQAARLRGRLLASFPGSTVDVTPHQGGATIFMQRGGRYVQVITGDKPGVVLRMMLGRDLRMVEGEATGGAA